MAIVAGGGLLLVAVVAVAGFLLWPSGSSSGGGSGGFDYADDFEGTWSGGLSQYDPDGGHVADWDLEIALLPGSRTGTGQIDTDDGTCTFDYTIDEAYDDELLISYDVTQGTEYCVETGEITLERTSSPRSLDVVVEAEWPDGTSTSDGALFLD